MEDGLVIDEKEFDTFPLLLIIILWKFHFGTAAMPYDSFAHKKKGWAFLPTTFVFSVIGKSIEKLRYLNSVEVSLVWQPKWHKDLMSEEAKLALDIY